MKRALAILAAFALSIVAVAETPAPRLAEATPPDWRGENGLVFAADHATIAFTCDGAGPIATLRRAPDADWQSAPLEADGPGRWLLDLPEPGWYDIRVSQADLQPQSANLQSRGVNLQPRSGDLQSRSDDLTAQSADLTLTVALVGEPIPEEWRENSVFGLWNVHGDPALIRLAGARWNRRMTSFRDVTQSEAEELGKTHAEYAEGRSHAEYAEGAKNVEGGEVGSRAPDSSRVERAQAAPYGERDGLRQVGVFSFGMPIWTMDMPEGIKLPSFGNPFYPAKDWEDVTRCVAAYARTHALPRDMSIYNEPLAHFKGKPAQIPDYARAVRKGLKAADPSFRIGGPGLYSIHIANLTKIESGDLLGSLDFLDMHAYVGGTPPEEEFIRKIEMLKEWLDAHGRSDMPIYLTEFGWTAASGTWQPPVDRATQARYVARSLALAWSQGMKALIYFALDFRTKKAGEAAFSLIGADGRPEAGFAAFAAVSRHFAASKPLGRFILAPGVHAVVGRREGRLQMMLWCEDKTPSREVVPPFAVISARDLFGSPISATAPLRISASPLFLEIDDTTGTDIATLTSKLAASLPPAPAPAEGTDSEKQASPPPLDIWPEGAKLPTTQHSKPHWEPFGDPLGRDGKVPDVDCAATVCLRHSGKGLAVELEVLDDEHCQTNTHDDPSQIWAQDSVQLGIDMDWGKPWEAGFAGAETSQTLGGHRVFEFSVGADGRGGGRAYLEQSWDDSLPMGTVREKVRVVVRRDDAARMTRYGILIPWSELGAAAQPPRPGETVGISIAVNDVDPKRGAPRHGLSLFGGIIYDKNPKLFGPAKLRPANGNENP